VTKTGFGLAVGFINRLPVAFTIICNTVINLHFYKALRMIVTNWTDRNLSGNRSGRADLKEGADVAVGEW
jgi:hypothetical protein